MEEKKRGLAALSPERRQEIIQKSIDARKEKALNPPTDDGEIKVLTPIKAIRAKCLDCMAGQRKEVSLCTTKTCSLFPYRMGKRPRLFDDVEVDIEEEEDEEEDLDEEEEEPEEEKPFEIKIKPEEDLDIEP
jgi:hypothetical protein